MLGFTRGSDHGLRPAPIGRGAVILKVYLTSDHISDATGETVAVVISKNGTAFGNPSGGATNATEIGNGWYYVDLSSTDTGTLGPLIVRGTAAACDNSEKSFDVVEATNRGMTAVPDAAVSTNASLLTSGTGTAQFSVSSGLVTLAPVTHTGAVIPAVTTTTTVTNGVAVTSNNDKTGYSLNLADHSNLEHVPDRGRRIEHRAGYGVGKWVLSGTTLTLYASDGTTAVRIFTLDSASTPTQRS